MKEIDYLLNLNPSTIKLGLDRTQRLLKLCEYPNKNMKIIQIVGTNGKGSVATMIHNVLMKNNYKVGLFTSPHLVNINERIKINYTDISNEEIRKFITIYKPGIEKIRASFFEVITVLSVWYFAKNNIDIAIMETGLGGRLDSVTACESAGLIVTSISKDHQHILGSTLKKISQEKSKAITKHTAFIVSTQQKKEVENIFIQRAKKKNQKIIFTKREVLNKEKDIFKYLKGEHQYTNGNLAIAAINQITKHFSLKMDYVKYKKDVLETFWPGRMQTLQKSPKIIFDVCHNAAGVNACNKYCDKYLSQFHRRYLLVAFESNKTIIKDLNKLVALFDVVIATEANIRKSMKTSIFKKRIKCNQLIINENINHALSTTIKKLKKNDILFIIGSHFFGPAIDKIFKNCFANYKKV